MSKSRDIADSAATINYIDGLTSDAQGQLDDKATLDGSPTFTGTVTATAFSGDGSGLTGVDSLPSQTGNNGLFLTTDGSTASWAEAGGGAWELLATYTPSGASTINIEDFSSTYDDYVIIGTLACSTTALPRIRIKIGAGSYGTSSYAYSTLNYNAFQYDSSQVAILMGDSIADGSNAASIKMSFITNCSNVNDSTYHGVYGQTNNATGYNVRGAAYSGYYHGSSGTLSGVQYLPSAGTYTGTIRIYGIKKA